METNSRIYLIPLQDEHIEHYMTLSGDPELIDTMGWKPFELDEHERFRQYTRVLSLPDVDGDQAVVFSIIDAAGGRPVGYTAIKGINVAESRAEVGIAVMEKEFRGQGYGTEALRQTVDYAINELGLTWIGLTVFSTNVRAIRSYEKLGFRKTVLLENSWQMPDGEYIDMWVMELPCDLDSCNSVK